MRKKRSVAPGASYQRKVATSVAEYVSIVETLQPVTPAGLWFRGHSDNGWQLDPSALRDVEALIDGRGQPVAPGTVIRSEGYAVSGLSRERMLQAFKQRSRPYIRDKPENDFEWMFVAQHHGLPTRLLDWSTNALVALYFAAEQAAWKADDPTEACERFLANTDTFGDGFAVFVIDPGQLIETTHDVRAPIDIAEASGDWDCYLAPVAADMRAYFPICVTAPHSTDRIRAQSGAFTLHGANIWALDYYTALRPMITKIILPSSVSIEVRASLARLGMTRGFIYADLDSIAKNVVATEREIYARERLDRVTASTPSRSVSNSSVKVRYKREASKGSTHGV